MEPNRAFDCCIHNLQFVISFTSQINLGHSLQLIYLTSILILYSDQQVGLTGYTTKILHKILFSLTRAHMPRQSVPP